MIAEERNSLNTFIKILTMKKPFVTLTTALIIVLSTSLSAQIGFKPYSTFVTGASASALVIKDIDGDGLKDIALITHDYSGNSTDFNLFIYYQNINGNLENPLVMPYPAKNWSDGAISIDAGDLNGDTKTDIALASDDSLVIFYQQNKTNFTIHSTYIGYSTDAIKIGDLNNDGRSDLAITQFNETNIHVFYQDADGNLNMINYPSLECGFVRLEICDINNDLLNDLLLFSNGGYNHGLFFYLQNADGTLGYPYSNGIGQFGGNAIAIGDLNHDTKPDIVITSGGNYPATLELYMQNSQSSGFNDPINLIAYDIPQPVCIEDLNCDGNNEILVAHAGWHAISCYEQDLQHNYSSYKLFDNTYGDYDMYNMATGDLNGDGRPDIAIAAGSLFIHYNNTRPTATDTITTREALTTETHNIDVNYMDQYMDTVNNYIVRITDSVNLKSTYNTLFGCEYKFEKHTGLVCNYYVNDSILIDSAYANWTDTISVVRTIFYHHVDTLGIYGMEELDKISQLMLYPNPTNGLLYFETKSLSKDLQISVLNATGTRENVPIAQNAVSIQIDMRKKPKGLYFVQIIFEGNAIYKKFLLL